MSTKKKKTKPKPKRRKKKSGVLETVYAPPKPVTRDSKGRFCHVATTAERREVFYTKPKRSALEKRAGLTPAEAEAEIRRVMVLVEASFNFQGLGAFFDVVRNRDGTVDGECRVLTVERIVNSTRSQVDEIARILHDIPNYVESIHPEVWFSDRLDFQAIDAVDSNGDSFEYDEESIELVGAGLKLSKERWKSKVLQTAWQKGHGKLYGNVQGAVNTAKNTIRKNKRFKPILTQFAFKLSWNPWNITPGKTRLEHEH